MLPCLAALLLFVFVSLLPALRQVSTEMLLLLLLLMPAAAGGSAEELQLLWLLLVAVASGALASLLRSGCAKLIPYVSCLAVSPTAKPARTSHSKTD